MSPLLSNLVRKARFDAVRPLVQGSVLDLGCGPIDVPQFAHPGQTYYGVEQDLATLAWLRERFPEHHFVARNLEKQAIAIHRRFDTILMLAILEHLADPDFLFGQLSGLLEQSGRIILTTPTPIGGRVHSLGARLGFFYREALDEHKAFYDRRDLESLFSKHGLSMIRYQPFLFGGNQLAVAALQGKGP